MYIAVGVYFDSRPDAKLSFETLDAALQKLRDWVEADEIDDEPMFCRYGLQIDPPLPRPYIDDEADAHPDAHLGPIRLPV